MSKKTDDAKSTDRATAAISPADPSIQHFVESMAATAKTEGKEQRKVLSSGTHDEGEGERILIVSKDGSHKIVFEKGEK